MVASIASASVARLGLLLGLSLFFGFAFEGFYAGEMPHRPGGVRTFPLLALTGGALYLLEPRYGAAFIAGLIVVGSWLYAHVRLHAESEAAEGSLVVPSCNVLAFILGALCVTAPTWFCIAVAVAAVLLLGSRRTLHDAAKRIPTSEIVTAGQFLILVGVVLPLLPGRAVIPYTTVTPFGIWLAVVAVSSISYASYLLQRYVLPHGGTLVTSILGGLISSTATTVVLARRARDEGMRPPLQAGVLAATAVMYVRILFVCALFNLALAGRLAAVLIALAVLSAVAAARLGRTRGAAAAQTALSNPLQLWTALIFAALFVAVSMLATFAQQTFGHAGIYVLAAVVGVTDIDPFVLSLAQGGAGAAGLSAAAIAILIAASSNNLLKAVYALGFSRQRAALVPAGALALLAGIGAAAAFFFIR
ncbi:MAG TPA: DUF4010 domain-containing protein [Candidatus Cybelea sp.]|jgi:uncharacterized membrane protein (DUF4010 family)|nr:DUF4010 domain-containing protein [Candidatus Cybelea sp.]